jgi:hypothetical protein
LAKCLRKLARHCDRARFFAVSAKIMRRILVDAARARSSAKRGGRQKVDRSTMMNFEGGARDRNRLRYRNLQAR